MWKSSISRINTNKRSRHIDVLKYTEKNILRCVEIPNAPLMMQLSTFDLCDPYPHWLVRLAVLSRPFLPDVYGSCLLLRKSCLATLSFMMGLAFGHSNKNTNTHQRVHLWMSLLCIFTRSPGEQSIFVRFESYSYCMYFTNIQNPPNY